MDSKILRKAYHRVVFPDGHVIQPGVVLFDRQGNFLSCHTMTSEEPFTEWIGGTFYMPLNP